MKLSYSWLKSYVDFDLSPKELAKLLTMHTAETVVEADPASEKFKGIVVAEIIEIKKHPNADKLSLVDIKTADGKFNIVCGGTNLKAGKKVAYAKVGAELPNGMVIKEALIRGVKSPGMICSAEELGLPKSGEMEILYLSDNAKLGDNVSAYLIAKDNKGGNAGGNADGNVGGNADKDDMNGKDVLLDVSIPANRPDLASHLGVAREISALTKIEIAIQEYKTPEIDEPKEMIKAEVLDKDLCPRFYGFVISGLKIEPSPDWMQERLKSLGLTPINNIVDATNFVMYDQGHPMHAFDYEKIAGGVMKIRGAKEGEEVATLDGIKHKLPDGAIIMQDSEKIFDLAGIMGGANSEISDSTTAIVLQASNFKGEAIRKTSRKLGIRTDASSMFERNISTSISPYVLAKTVALLREKQKGLKVHQIIDIRSKKDDSRVIELSGGKIKNYLEIDFHSEEIAEIFRRLGFQTDRKGGTFFVRVPAFRIDLKGPEDLIEEIIRIYGYDKIPSKFPRSELKPAKENMDLKWEKIAKNTLANSGFYEVYNYSFTGKKMIEMLALDMEEYFKVINPKNPDNEYLRTTLIMGILQNITDNLPNFEKFSIFELGKVFYSKGRDMKEAGQKENFIEKKMLTGAVVNAGRKELEFYGAKGVVERLLYEFGFSKGETKFEHLDVAQPTFHPGRTATVKIKVKGEGKFEEQYFEDIGFVGEIHPDMLERFGIKTDVALFDLDFEKLLKYASEKIGYVDVPKFPSITLDMAVEIDEEVPASEVLGLIASAGGDLIYDIDLFDIYQGKQVGKGRKSLAFHIIYLSEERTLKEKEAKEIHDRIAKTLKERFNAVIR